VWGGKISYGCPRYCLARWISSPEESRKALLGQVKGSVEIYEYFHIYLHSFTIVVLDEKDRECEIGCKIKHFHEVPGWRNWQTQRTQNPPTFGSWGFDSPSRHHFKNPWNTRLPGLALRTRSTCAADAADFAPTYNQRALVYPTENSKFTYKVLY
jgi:hypothetical protein